jgi:hypothetical protein
MPQLLIEPLGVLGWPREGQLQLMRTPVAIPLQVLLTLHIAPRHP